MRFALFIALAWMAFSADGTDYYVDFDAGSDAAAGTATGTAWKTIPGTRDTGDTAYVSAAWGSFTTAAKVPDNTTIKIKGGTTHDSGDGGYVWVGVGLYAIGYTNLVIETDSGWGTGNAVIDGTGMTAGIALVLVQIDGVTVRNITIQDGPYEGIEIKEKAGTSAAQTNLWLEGLVLTGNGTAIATDTEGAGKGQINVKWANTVTITNCLMNGGGNFINGIMQGDSGKWVVNSFVVSCTATNHKGDLVTDDSGIGFKSINGQITFSNCVSSYNLKGWDGGEQNGANSNITYKVINGTASHNAWGINGNGSAGVYSGAITHYAINCLVVSNYMQGMNYYAGPWAAYLVHNTMIGNGWSNTAALGASVVVTVESAVSTNEGPVRMFVRNCIMAGSDGPAYLNKRYSTNLCMLTLDSDWNAYQQNAAEKFVEWSYFIAAGPPYSFPYGVNGAGHASGNWYDWYGGNANVPAFGSGHYHSDANSRGTGAADTAFPDLAADYTLNAGFAGLDLSGESWFISEMGLDRLGRSRWRWDLGTTEYGARITATANTVNVGTLNIGQ